MSAERIAGTDETDNKGQAMSWLARLGAWWFSGKPKRVEDLLSVAFGEHEVRVIALDPSLAAWHQHFRWNDIARACYRDEGICASDLIVIELRERQPAMVPAEARGGAAFFGRLVERGLFSRTGMAQGNAGNGRGESWLAAG